MSVPLIYIGVIIIWSTTPLGIAFSGEEVGYEFGVAMRMAIGLAILSMVIWLRRIPFPLDAYSRKVYLISGASLFSAMSLVYWSAQFIPSGWIAVVFGLSPVFVSLLSFVIRGENTFSTQRIIGIALGLSGLVIVFFNSLTYAEHAWVGIVGVVLSAMAQSTGAVYMKKLQPTMPAISLTAGSVGVALPFFAFNSIFIAGLPESVPMHSMLAIGYLAILGTSIGFPMYYYLLQNLSAERIALITLITPVAALVLGALLNDELIDAHVWIGTLCIITGLAIYEYGHHVKKEHRQQWFRRWKRNPL